MAERAQDAAAPRRRWIRALQVALSLSLAAGIFLFAIPRIADYSAVWQTMSRLTRIELATLLAATALNLALAWPVMTAAMPGLTIGRAAVNNLTTTSIANTLPGGGAIAVGVGYAMYRSWGYPRSAIALTTLVTGIWNAFAKLALPLVALAILAVEGNATGALVVAAEVGLLVLATGLVLLALTLWRAAFARSIGSGIGRIVSVVRRVFGKLPVSWEEAALLFRKQAIRLLRNRWLALSIATIASHLSLLLVLLLALRHVGVSGAEIGWAQILGVFAFGRLVSAFPITPGGLGIVELSYIGGLVLAGRDHADVPPELFRAQVAAAVLVFRTMTYALPIPIGSAAYLVWHRGARGGAIRPRES